MPARQAGFTLIEMLIGLAILMLAAGAVTRTLVTGMDLSSRAERESRALEVAENALAVAVGSRGTPATVSTRLDGGMERIVTIRPRPDLVKPMPGGALAAYEVGVLVRWPDGRAQRSLTLSTLRLEAAP
jgi:prepilin-type N-terminal cleavage/methylation domain-containing protein